MTERWSTDAIADAEARIDEIVEAVGSQAPLGAWRAAERVAARIGVAVAADDIRELDARGVLRPAGHYKGRVLYDALDLDKTADEHADLIAGLVTEREAWLAASLRPSEAQELLGWSDLDFDLAVGDYGIKPGRFNRIRKEDVAALASAAESEQPSSG